MSTIDSKKDPLYVVSDPDLVLIPTVDNGVPVSLKPLQLGIKPAFGSHAVTVGANGDYASFSLAFSAIIALPQFNESVNALTGTSLTVTQGSRNVTGVGTNFTSMREVWISVTYGSNTKWYPVDRVVDDESLTLLVDFGEVDLTETDMSKVMFGSPVMHKIKMLDNSNDFIKFGITYTGIKVYDLALILEFDGYQANPFYTDFESGVFEIRGLTVPEWVSNNVFTRTNDVNATCQYKFKGMENVATLRADFLQPTSGRSSRVGLFDSNLNTSFDAFAGQAQIVEIRNSRITAYPRVLSTVTTRSPIQQMFFEAGGRFNAKNSSFIAGAIGSSAGVYLCQINAGSSPSGNIWEFSDCDFTADANNSAGFSLVPAVHMIYINTTIDSTAIFRRCNFGIIGDITVPSGWNFINLLSGNTGNKIIFEDCILPDLPSILSETIEIELIGSQNRVKLMDWAATLPANELDFLRADSFRIYNVGATSITSVPSVKNAPEGSEIDFTFVNWIAGNQTVTGWDAEYVFHTAWSNTPAPTANDVSTIRFRRTNGKWYQISHANTWFK